MRLKSSKEYLKDHFHEMNDRFNDLIYILDKEANKEMSDRIYELNVLLRTNCMIILESENEGNKKGSEDPL